MMVMTKVIIRFKVVKELLGTASQRFDLYERHAGHRNF